MNKYNVEVNYDGNVFPIGTVESTDQHTALAIGAGKFMDVLFQVTDEEDFAPELMHVTAEELRTLN